MKKICMLLTNAFEPDVRVYKEAKYLVDKGCSVEILCWDRKKDSCRKRKERVDGINIIRFRKPSIAGTGFRQIGAFLGFVNACRKYCKKRHFDYFHCNDFDGAVVWSFIKNDKARMIFDMHEYYEGARGMSRISSFLIRKAIIYFIKRSNYSLYENDLYLKKAYDSVKNKLLQLKNYPDLDIIKFIPKKEAEEFRVGYHGDVRNQIPEFKTLFEAVKDISDIRVDIHGGGIDLPKLIELEQEYKNVYIHGPYNGLLESTELYANTDVVFAGYQPKAKRKEYEEIVKFYECIVTGTPIIMTESYIGMALKINKYGFGLTCDTLDVESVKKAIVKLKEDKKFWKKCHQSELLEAPKYNWNNEVKVLDIAYDLEGRDENIINECSTTA